jgi:DNA-binding CsgD family transcriptional regulator
VLKLVADGFTRKEIAATLGISFHTVVTHCKLIRLSLGCKNMNAAVAECFRRGILE